MKMPEDNKNKLDKNNSTLTPSEQAQRRAAEKEILETHYFLGNPAKKPVDPPTIDTHLINISEFLKEREIDHKIIGGYEVKVEDLKEQIQQKDRILEQKEKRIHLLQAEIKRLNEKIEQLYFNFPAEIEKQLERLSEIPKEIAKDLPAELNKKFQETQELVYREVLIRQLEVEKAKLGNELKKRLIFILRKSPISNELIAKFESESFESIFTYIASFFNKIIEAEEKLISEATNLKDYLDSFLKKNWSS